MEPELQINVFCHYAVRNTTEQPPVQAKGGALFNFFLGG